MFLDYFALTIVLVVIVAVFYTFIYIHDIPYNEAKKRNHPQKEAIHVACWLSLFTLHAIWPIVFIWSITKPKPLEVAVSGKGVGDPDLSRRLALLEDRLQKLEG
jgi:hypothetical protein